MTVDLQGLSLIGGEPVRSTGAAFAAVDAATGEILGPEYNSADAADVDRAARLADEAFATYDSLPGRARAEFLRRIAAGIENLGDALVTRATAETALPAARIQSEQARTCGQLRLFADLAEEGRWVDARVDRADSRRRPLPKPDVRSLLRPLGPVAVFGAGNFPLAFSVAGGDTAAALAVGCPVIVKSHPSHPGTSELVGRVVVEAARASGIHPGVFALLCDAGTTVGQALVRHPLVKAGAFTGSRTGGMALARIAAERPEPMPFFAEMSSVNPVFLLPGMVRTDGPAIAAGLHAALTLGMGQFCTNPGLTFAVDDEATAVFRAELEVRIRATATGMMLSPAIRETYERQLGRVDTVAGVRASARSESTGHARQARATLFVTTAEVFRAQSTLAEEVFGPAGLVVLCRSVDEFAELAARLEGQLTASVWGGDTELRSQAGLVALLERKAGRLLINAWPTGVEVGPAMVHGGPFPATTDSRFSSVGTRSIYRFVRPVAYQNFPEWLLPEALRPVDPLTLGAKWTGT